MATYMRTDIIEELNSSHMLEGFREVVKMRLREAVKADRERAIWEVNNHFNKAIEEAAQEVFVRFQIATDPNSFGGTLMVQVFPDGKPENITPQKKLVDVRADGSIIEG